MTYQTSQDWPSPAQCHDLAKSMYCSVPVLEGEDMLHYQYLSQAEQQRSLTKQAALLTQIGRDLCDLYLDEVNITNQTLQAHSHPQMTLAYSARAVLPRKWLEQDRHLLNAKATTQCQLKRSNRTVI